MSQSRLKKGSFNRVSFLMKLKWNSIKKLIPITIPILFRTFFDRL